MTLKRIQLEQKEWSEHNFPGSASHCPLLGVGEEIGEFAEVSASDRHVVELSKALGRLNHSHLKKEQGIRVNQDHAEEAMDAIGDILIYLGDYCNKKGYSMESILTSTWNQVRQRDWIKHPKNGLTE